MKKDLPKYVVDLKGVWYFKRRGWPTRKFATQSLTPSFWAEYAQILNAVAPKPSAFLIKGLVTDYTSCAHFNGLKPRTKADYLKYLSKLERKAGSVVVREIQRKNVIAWRDQLAKSETPHYANYYVRVVKLLLEHAIDIGHIKENPAKGVGSLKYEKRTAKPWSQDKIARVRSAYPLGDRTRLLFEMLYCTGQRIGDVLDAKWLDIHGTAISVRQNKTHASLELEITPELAECLKRAQRFNKVPTILANYRGTGSWSYRGAADAMMKLRIAVGAEENTIHDIRHTVASEIVTAGGSDEDVMSVTGHTTTRMAGHYSASTRQISRAKRAQASREQNKNGS
jgi:integrase